MFWLGSTDSLNDYLRRQARLDAANPGEFARPEYADGGYQLYGNVAVIDVKGPLTNHESWLNEFFGITSYGSIRNKLVEAHADSRVQEIVLNVDSPGGSATGISDTGELIKQIDRSKPVTAFASGTAASAALWLATSAGATFASETSMVGSLGVICTVMDATGALEKDGLKATVIRTGPKKALGGPYETLTDDAKEEIQKQLNHLHDIFVETVADNRGLTVDHVRSQIGDGSEFIGEQARQVGLIDGITTLDALVGGLQLRHEAQNPRKDMTMARRKLLNERQVALIAEGVEPEVAMNAAPEDPTPEAPEAPAAPEAPVEPEVPAAPAEPEAAAQTPAAPDLVGYLQTELAAKSGEITQLNVKVAELERELSGFRAHDTALKAIVASSVQRMQVGLGGVSTDLSKLTTEALLSQHAQVYEAFTKRYPVGGVAAQADPEGEDSTEMTPLARARLRAVKSK